MTAIAANISDVDTGDPPDHPAANFSFSFATADAAPSVTTTSPADAADHVAVNTNIVVNFSEPVTATTSSFTLECPAGTPESFSVSGSPGSSITLDPTSNLPEGTVCSVKVIATQISDVDTVDPPDNMAADYNFSFTTDSAPAVTTTTPAGNATDVDPTTNITVNFNENVDVTTSSFTILCDGNPQTFGLSGSGTSSITLDPDSDLPSTASCTVTAVAANISDSDTGDPPDHPAANTSFSFTIAHRVLPGQVVVSQVYGGGGNTGAPYANDYIEVFNRSLSLIDLTGMSVQYTSATGTGNFGSATNLITPLSGFLAPGQYLLAQEASGGAVGAPLPTPDVTDATPINMSATGGKVALVNSTTGLGCNGSSTPCSAAQAALIVDLIGYDGANFYEGSPAPALSNTTAALRGNGGCKDTDNNAADFTAGAPNPRNRLSPTFNCAGDAAPSVASTTPANNATDVATNANVSITFSEPVNVTGSWYSISCGTSGSHTAAVSGGPVTFTLDPGSDFSTAETCTVTVFAANVSDQDANDPPDTMAANYVFSFTTVAPPVAIHEIQGTSHISPLTGQNVSGVNGIVTAKRTNGFYMQDPNPDANEATSEGIFVFTSSAPSSVNVGDAVKVNAKVQEFRAGGASSTNLTTTELATPSITVLSTGNLVPQATTVGTGGRVPPNQIIEDDATGDVETSGVFDPSNDGLDFWESLEGMRVQLNDPVAVGPTNAFGETQVVGDDGANAGLHTARGGLLLRPTDANPERVVADDVLVPLPAMNVGDHYDAPLVGVLDYNFGNFFLEVTSAGVGAIHDGVTPESTTAAGLNQVSVGTFNFENLDPTDPQSKFDRLAGILVNNLKSPDIVSGEEVQDNNGPTDDGVVSSNQTLDQLVAAIQAAGGPTYAYRYINPVNDQDGGEPGGNIRQVFLFRTDRGVSFIDRPGGNSTTATTVVNGVNGPELSYSPGRIDPSSSAFNTSRKPLAGEFTFNGHHLFVIANHFNSKGGDDPLEGHLQPPTRSSEVQRHQQAQIVHDFVASILGDDANANVVVDGDLNDFEFSNTVSILKSGVLHDLMDTLPPDERYSYVFEGNSQTLDHILTSDALFAVPFVYDVVHVNAEFADQASDHDPSAVKITLNDAPTDIQLSNSSIAENQPSGTNVGTLTTTDPDAGDTHAYTLENTGCGGGPFPDNSSFQSGGVGNDKLQSAASFDFETKNSYTICVRSTDSGVLSFDKQFTISITT